MKGPSWWLDDGEPDSPVLLHVPHASRVLPRAVRRQILLDDQALAAELDHMTDAHTDLLAERAAARAGPRPWRFTNGLSRLVVDPERFPDEREEMRAVGMGAVYTRTSHGAPLRFPDPAHEQALLDAYFTPYAAAMTDSVAGLLVAAGRAVIIDVHSYASAPLPYELHATGARPAVCLGTDAFHTPRWLLAAAHSAFAGCGTVAQDSPFSGAYVPLALYGREPRLAALMVEIRRDGYLLEPGGPPHEGLDRLAQALAELIDAASRAV